jgi:hypothetical protein
MKPIAEQVQQHAREVLWSQRNRRNTGLQLTLQRDVEALVLRTGAMIGKVQRLIDQSIEIHRSTLAGASARMFQHAPHDAVGTSAVFVDLTQIAGERACKLIDLAATSLVQQRKTGCGRLLQFIQEID